MLMAREEEERPTRLAPRPRLVLPRPQPGNPLLPLATPLLPPTRVLQLLQLLLT